MNFEQFMKKNKVAKVQKIQYAPTKSMLDDDGKPLEWTLRRLASQETDRIREQATNEVEVKKGQFRPKLDINKYMLDLVVASAEVPNLNDQKLQESYEVMGATELLYAMIDDPQELAQLEQKVQELCGFTATLQDDIDTAKN